jgi:hypothetical protein
MAAKPHVLLVYKARKMGLTQFMVKPKKKWRHLSIACAE